MKFPANILVFGVFAVVGSSRATNQYPYEDEHQPKQKGFNTCGDSSAKNETEFANPSYPKPDSDVGKCEYIVNRMDDNICQIRIDFIVFDLAQPNVEGQCVTDVFKVSGGLYQIPKLCGNNRNQHLYIDVEQESCPLRIIVNTDPTTSYPRTFHMKFTHIPCDSATRAPTGCLQYFTSSSGSVKSFNYPQKSFSLPFKKASLQKTDDTGLTQHLADLQYTVCIRPDLGCCSISWSPNPSAGSYNFFLTSNIYLLSNSTFGTVDVLDKGDACLTDYVIIPGGVYTGPNLASGSSADRFCGAGFPDSITSNFLPFYMYVKTDGKEQPVDKGNFGFDLLFRQSIC